MLSPESIRRPLAALAGIVAGITALGFAELVTAMNSTFVSPVVSVGDRVIDFAPPWLKDTAISLFGTNDKLALLIGIAALVLAYAATVGVLAFRRNLAWGLIGIGLFGAIGAAAAVAEGEVLSSLPSVGGALAGMAVLWFLHRGWQGGSEVSESRRHLLAGLGASALLAGGFGATGVFLGRRFAIDPSSGVLPPVRQALAPIPSGTGFDVPGLASFVTTNEDFYRIDTALTVPQIAAADYSLKIFGMVDREVVLTYQDLLNLPQVEADITLTCVSNEVGGRLVGNARWQGVLLSDVLAQAGIQSGADQIVGRSFDGYTCGFPTAALEDGREALIALGMNGDPLPAVHGYPVRLVVPGLYGYVSGTKWLEEIELTTFAAFDQYWVPRGWAAEAPIKTSSRIDTPAAFTALPPGKQMIAGVAWAQTRGIETVEVSIDDGPWQLAELAEELNNTTWRQWRLEWDVTPGRHTITVRSTDTTGALQVEERARPMPDGATGWHQIVVTGQ
ncbi:sulfite oxidase [soil metagenome]